MGKLTFAGIRPGVARLFRLAIRRPEITDADVDEEIRLHLALRVRQLQAQGYSLTDAQAEAERRFGPPEEARERFHHSARRRENRMRTRESFDALRQDLRIALRGFRRNPGFVATAVLCLALGIGANVATYSMFEELLLRPLPVHEPERLVNLSAPGPKPGTDNCNQSGPCEVVFSYPMFRDLERAPTELSGVAAHRLLIGNIVHERATTFGDAILVSGSYFPLLGVRPAAGRLLSRADDETVGAHPVAVLSHDYWTERLGADPAVLGTRILFNNQPLTIIGVGPPGFSGTTVGVRPAVFIPLTMAQAVNPWMAEGRAFTQRREYWLYLFARLKPGVSIERARASVNGVYSRILADVEAPLQVRMSEQTMARFKAKQVIVEDGRRGQSNLQGDTRMPLLVLLGITGLVVVIASANIANLLLARAATRTTEMGIRLSLGAGRRRIVTQLLVESCLLAVLGGIVSLAVARGILHLVGSMIPPAGGLGMGASLALELRPSVLLFASGLSIGAGILFGLFPALQSTRSDLATILRSSSGQAAGARGAARFRAGVVTVQIAMSMALLISAGLFIRSLRNISREDLGVRVDNVVTFGLAPVLNGYDARRSQALFADLAAALAEMPGVTGVTTAAIPLLTGSNSGLNVRVEGFRRGPDTDANTRWNAGGPGYFRTLGIELLAGRDFLPSDDERAPKVAVVNEAFARKFGIGPNPIGRRMAQGSDDSEPLDIEIVGLAKDTKYSSVKGNMPPLLVMAYRQDTTINALVFYVRTSVTPENVMQAIPATIARLDPNLPVVSLTTMERQVKENTFMDRMVGLLSTMFALVATLLTAVGLYGVLAFTVAQRTREFGVRMALGADGSRMRRMVLGQVGRMTIIGAVVGVAGALALGRAAQSLLFGLEGNDPLTMIAAVAVISCVALAAAYVPAWRASRVDPMRALRQE